MEMEQEPKKFGGIRPWLLIVLAVVVLAAIGFFVWKAWQKSKIKTLNSNYEL